MLCLICALSDALLIAAGVAGLGTLIATVADACIVAVTVAGAVFLFAYAVLAFRRALRPQALIAAAAGDGSLERRRSPPASPSPSSTRMSISTRCFWSAVAVGPAMTGRPASLTARARRSASFVWFFGLGYGARLLQPVFARPAAWRVLDLMIAVVMTAIGLGLLGRLAYD